MITCGLYPIKASLLNLLDINTARVLNSSCLCGIFQQFRINNRCVQSDRCTLSTFEYHRLFSWSITYFNGILFMILLYSCVHLITVVYVIPVISEKNCSIGNDACPLPSYLFGPFNIYNSFVFPETINLLILQHTALSETWESLGRMFLKGNN